MRILLLILLLPIAVYGTPIIDGFIPLGNKCSYLTDEESNLTIQEVQSSFFRPLFQPIQSIQPIFGFVPYPIWFHCEIPSYGDSFLFLEIANPLLDEILLYEFQGTKKIDELKLGDQYPFLQRNLEYRNFLIPTQSNRDIFLRISSKGLLHVPIYLWNHKKLIEKIHTENLYIGIFIGLTILLILYHLYLFVYFKETYYLYYVFFTFGWLVLFLNTSGISFQYLWPNAIWWTNYNFPIGLFFTSSSAILFVRSFLNIKEFSIILHKILSFIAYFGFILIPIPIIIDYTISLKIGIIYGIFILHLIPYCAIYIILKDASLSKYLAIGWIFLYLSIFLFFLHSIGKINRVYIIEWTIFPGIAFFLFALGLGYKIQTIKQEQEKAKEDIIQMQKIAIENIKMNQKQQEMLVAMNQELKIARDIHQSILPQFVPQIPGVSIHVTYIPMAEIGGDMYEFYYNPQTNELGIFIADVAGHGIPAALLSSILKAAFSFHKNYYKEPDKFLKNINASIVSMENNQMASAAYLYLDLKNKTASYANSGHPPLLVWRRKKKTIESYFPEGKMIGWLPDSGNKISKLTFESGDKFYLYTDGITEVRKTLTQIWGEDNLVNFLREYANVPVEEMVKDLLQTLRDFSGKENGFEDDISFIVIEIL